MWSPSADLQKEATEEAMPTDSRKDKANANAMAQEKAPPAMATGEAILTNH